MTTVFELADEAVAPVLAAVPERPYPPDHYRPDIGIDIPSLARSSGASGNVGDEAEHYLSWVTNMTKVGIVEDGQLNEVGTAVMEALLHARVRVVCTGVFAEEDHPLDVRCYADNDYAYLVRHHYNGAMTLRYGPLFELSTMLAEVIPERRTGSGPITHINVGEDGEIPAERAGDVDAVRRSLARPRLGTMNFDIAMGDVVFVSHPDRTFAWIDNDQGRYVISNMWKSSGQWQFMHGPSGFRQFQTIIQGAVSELEDE